MSTEPRACLTRGDAGLPPPALGLIPLTLTPEALRGLGGRGEGDLTAREEKVDMAETDLLWVAGLMVVVPDSSDTTGRMKAEEEEEGDMTGGGLGFFES